MVGVARAGVIEPEHVVAQRKLVGRGSTSQGRLGARTVGERKDGSAGVAQRTFPRAEVRYGQACVGIGRAEPRRAQLTARLEPKR